MANCDPTTPDEIWYPLPSWPGYELSSDMRLRAHATPDGPRRSGIKKLTLASHGYLMTEMRRGGRKHTVCLHVLVAELAYGSTPEGMRVRHWNDDKGNNYPSNLAIGTQAENVHDMLRNGHARVGEQCAWAKLSNENVREIRRELASKMVLQKDLARRFNVHPCVISHINSRKRWKTLQ